MTSYRYLMHFAYIGKQYRGLQIQRNCHPNIENTVQNILQENLRKLLKQPDLKTKISSRTDKGVNALSSYIHFDLPLGSTLDNGHILQPPDLEKLARNVNGRLHSHQESIRVLKIQQVPSTFHCRFNALTRSYVYRLAIGRQDGEDTYNQAFVESKEMQWIWCPLFNTGKFIKAAEMFSGKKQFVLYRQYDKKNKFVGPTKRFVVVHIRRGNSLSNEYCGGSAELWDVHITSNAFMRKQVRKMVGGMVNVAKGISSMEELKQMLKGKGKKNVRHPAGPEGLFLKSTVYNPTAFDFNDDVADQLLNESCVFEGPRFKKENPHRTSSCVYRKISKTHTGPVAVCIGKYLKPTPDP